MEKGAEQNLKPCWRTLNVRMENGDVFEAEKIDELVKEIIDKFAGYKLTSSQGKVVLKRAQELLDNYSVVSFTNIKSFSKPAMSEMVNAENIKVRTNVDDHPAAGCGGKINAVLNNLTNRIYRGV